MAPGMCPLMTSWTEHCFPCSLLCPACSQCMLFSLASVAPVRPCRLWQAAAVRDRSSSTDILHAPAPPAAGLIFMDLCQDSVQCPTVCGTCAQGGFCLASYTSTAAHGPISKPSHFRDMPNTTQDSLQKLCAHAFKHACIMPGSMHLTPRCRQATA